MKSALAGDLLLLVITLPLAAQQPADWQDPASHSVRFVAVAQDVRLEVLDWGGTGRPLVLLAGGTSPLKVMTKFAQIPKTPRADGRREQLPGTAGRRDPRRGPGATVVKLTPANHSVFLSNEVEVLREMRACMAGLR